MNLTEKQLEKALKIMESTSVARKKVTMYKKNDTSLALFRIEACNMIEKAVICQVTNKPYPKKLKTYLTNWSIDGPGGIGEDIIELFNQIEKENN